MSFFDVLNNFIESLTHVWCITNCLVKNDKYNNTNFAGFTILIFFLLLYLNLTDNFNIYITISLFFICVIYSVRYFKNNIIEKISIGLTPLLLSLIATMISINIPYVLLGLKFVEIDKDNYQYVFIIAITRIIHLFVSYIIVKNRKSSTATSIDKKWFWIVIALFATIVSTIISYEFFIKYDMDMIFIVLIIINITIFICGFVGVITIKNDEKIQIENLIELNELKCQTSIINQSKINYVEIKTLKHDLKHQLSIIRGFLENEDLSGAILNLDLYSSEIKNLENTFYTGNYVIDYVIALKIKNARNNGISVKCEVATFDIKYDLSNLGIILGNILDNAIENCNHSKKIEFILKEVEGLIMIRLTNTIDNEKNISNINFKTTKKNKKMHGLGLNSVKRKVVRADGDIYISKDNGVFILEIIIPNDRDKVND